jgi:hypothetical protein
VVFDEEPPPSESPQLAHKTDVRVEEDHLGRIVFDDGTSTRQVVRRDVLYLYIARMLV